MTNSVLSLSLSLSRLRETRGPREAPLPGVPWAGVRGY